MSILIKLTNQYQFQSPQSCRQSLCHMSNMICIVRANRAKGYKELVYLNLSEGSVPLLKHLRGNDILYNNYAFIICSKIRLLTPSTR